MRQEGNITEQELNDSLKKKINDSSTNSTLSKQQIGTLTALQTADKSNLVNAINEVKAGSSNIGGCWGTNTSYAVTINMKYEDGRPFYIVPHVTCGNNPTLSVNGNGALYIRNTDNETLAAGDMIAGVPVMLVKYGANFFRKASNKIKMFPDDDNVNPGEGSLITSNTLYSGTDESRIYFKVNRIVNSKLVVATFGGNLNLLYLPSGKYKVIANGISSGSRMRLWNNKYYILDTFIFDLKFNLIKSFNTRSAPDHIEDKSNDKGSANENFSWGRRNNSLLLSKDKRTLYYVQYIPTGEWNWSSRNYSSSYSGTWAREKCAIKLTRINDDLSMNDVYNISNLNTYNESCIYYIDGNMALIHEQNELNDMTNGTKSRVVKYNLDTSTVTKVLFSDKIGAAYNNAGHTENMHVYPVASQDVDKHFLLHHDYYIYSNRDGSNYQDTYQFINAETEQTYFLKSSPETYSKYRFRMPLIGVWGYLTNDPYKWIDSGYNYLNNVYYGDITYGVCCPNPNDGSQWSVQEIPESQMGDYTGRYRIRSYTTYDSNTGMRTLVLNVYSL